jgi:hypothetical protein
MPQLAVVYIRSSTAGSPTFNAIDTFLVSLEGAFSWFRKFESMPRSKLRIHISRPQESIFSFFTPVFFLFLEEVYYTFLING